MHCTKLLCCLLIVTVITQVTGKPKGGKGKQKEKDKGKDKGKGKGAQKECTRNLNNIRIQRKFDMDKFSGTWYTIHRTTSVFGANTYKSASIEFHKNNDGSYSYSYTAKSRGACIPVESGAVEGTKWQVLKDNNVATNHPSMLVSFTDYKKMALVAFCFRYEPRRKNQCAEDGLQVEILTRDEKPKNKDIKYYLSKAEKRLCASPSDMKKTFPGQCKIPDILAAVKKPEVEQDVDDTDDEETEEGEEEEEEEERGGEEEEEDGGEEKPEGKCVVNNIPVQEEFELKQMEGLWYEIARTRFTVNKMESVVAHHRYDNVTKRITSHYTGTLTLPDTSESTCMAAILGSSKTTKDSQYVGDMVGRIGDDNDGYPWSPMKVLYADDNFLMFYACYSGETDTECAMEEVTLNGRSRDIDDETRERLYEILPSICIDKEDMITTEDIDDCSEWVIVEEKDIIQPEDCLVDSIPVHNDFLKSDVFMKWYRSAYISYRGNDTLTMVVMEQTSGHGMQTLHSYVSAQMDGICSSFERSSRDRCVDDADFIATPLEEDHGGFEFSKILYVDDNLMVEYTCSRVTVEGTCEREGILFSVYTRNQTINDDDVEIINALASTACLNPANLTYETEWCDDPLVPEENAGSSGCDIDNIDLFSDLGYTPEELYGTWYEIARSTGEDIFGTVESAVAYFTSDSNETMRMYYTGFLAPDNSTCSDVSVVSLFTRCQSDCNGDYLMRVEEDEGPVKFAPFKVIYTDYRNMLLLYVCHNVTAEGHCTDDGSQVRIMSRNMTLSEDDFQYLRDLVFWLCIDPDVEGYFQTDLQRETESCDDVLEQYINENELANELDLDVVERIDDPSQQRDQGEKELSDIDEALAMNDDEFYSDDS